MSAPAEIVYRDCNDNVERLTHESIDDAVRDQLDGWDVALWPDALPVYGWKRMHYEFDADRILDRAIEDADEEHGDPDGDGSEPNAAMLAAAQAFAEALQREYVPWCCEQVAEATVEVEVAGWVREHEPKWCADPEVAAWLASRPEKSA